jgi:hypothetical protein
MLPLSSEVGLPTVRGFGSEGLEELEEFEPAGKGGGFAQVPAVEAPADLIVFGANELE